MSKLKSEYFTFVVSNYLERLLVHGNKNEKLSLTFECICGGQV